MKRKNEETPVDGVEENVVGEEAQTKTPEVSENLADAVETPATPQNVTDEQPSQEEKSTGKTGKRSTKSKTPEVSEAVDAVLKKFPQYDELYVDAVGGVYTKDSQLSLVEGAILYQNPYYNK